MARSAAKCRCSVFAGRAGFGCAAGLCGVTIASDDPVPEMKRIPPCLAMSALWQSFAQTIMYLVYSTEIVRRA